LARLGSSVETVGMSAPSRLSLWVERILPIFVLTVALVGAPIMIFSAEGLPRLRGLSRELDGVEEENKKLQREIEELRGHADRLREDPKAVENIARDDLGLVRQSEVVFQFKKQKK
jgi:cell division protein FtsB